MTPGAESLYLNHSLIALAWIGDEVVQNAFAEWRRNPPAWTEELHVAPHEYAVQAGWELMASGARRDLFHPMAFPLVRPDDPTAVDGPVKVGFECPESCGWCRQQLTALPDLDLSSPALRPLGFVGTRLRMMTCHACTCFGPVFTDVDFDGAAKWSRANTRPGFLPDHSSAWDCFPEGRLLLSAEPRHFLESASWLLPGVSGSQIGGYPTWIQDAEYFDCPSCSQQMPFVGQIDFGDCTQCGEGIYHMFCCRNCGVAATTYQQS
jgi:hypothetical protein